MLDNFEKFFAPKSVVVIGASAIAHKPGNDVIRNILANGYSGKLYLINPKGGEIMGMKVESSIHNLPVGIDLAVVILPANANPQAIRDCASRGIKAIVLAAGGFSEVDESGEKLQEDLIRAVRETGVRVLGPNTSGHTSTPHYFTSSFFPLGKIPRGNISYIAQTGNFATHTMRYIATAENFGVARVIGLGNKVDIEESEVLEYLAGDPETRAIFIYLESFKKPRRFLKVAQTVTQKKPVFLLKGGSTAEGAKAAVAHTAAMAAEDRITDAMLHQVGRTRLYQYSHLFLAAKGLASMPLPRGNRVSFLAPSGAMLVCLTDYCLSLRLKVPDFTDPTRKFLQDISQSIIDLTAEFPEKPIYVTFTGEKKHMDAGKAFLEPKGVPTFPLIEEPFEVLSFLARCRNVLN